MLWFVETKVLAIFFDAMVACEANNERIKLGGGGDYGGDGGEGNWWRLIGFCGIFFLTEANNFGLCFVE